MFNGENEDPKNTEEEAEQKADPSRRIFPQHHNGAYDTLCYETTICGRDHIDRFKPIRNTPTIANKNTLLYKSSCSFIK